MIDLQSRTPAHPVVLWVGIGAVTGSIFGSLFTLLVLWLR